MAKEMKKNKAIEIRYLEKTDIGKKRKVNQDAVLARKAGETALFVVADGMGGHSHGEYASSEIVSACKRYWEQEVSPKGDKSFSVLLQEVEQVLQEASNKIYVQYNRAAICGSTVVVLLLAEGCYGVLSVGDSHIYTYCERELSLLTTDDIWDNLSVTREQYTEEEIKHHVNRGRLVGAMGIGEKVSLHVQTGRFTKKQKFMLCSDGLYKYCDDAYLKRTLKQLKSERSMMKVAKRYMEHAYRQGANDNISFILVDVF